MFQYLPYSIKFAGVLAGSAAYAFVGDDVMGVFDFPDDRIGGAFFLAECAAFAEIGYDSVIGHTLALTRRTPVIENMFFILVAEISQC